MSFAKNFGSKHGKKFLNKRISASKRIKDTASKFNQSKYGKKIAGKKILPKSAEATGDLIGSRKSERS